MSALPTDPWPIRWSCAEVDTHSPAATGIAATAATQLLWLLSGQQFGLRTTTLRPCRRGCAMTNGGYLPDGIIPWPASSYGYPWPSLYAGTWVNLGCGACGYDSCACARLEEALLPGQVYDVTQVKVDGVALTGTAYRLDRVPSVWGDVLVRLDGQAWPLCQDLTKPDTQAGTWSVTARYGQPVPELASLAVGELACELLRGMAGEDCRVPREVVSLARQGVTLQYADASALASAGLLGLTVCDRFLRAVNPHGLRHRARTWSPDAVGLRQVGP